MTHGIFKKRKFIQEMKKFYFTKEKFGGVRLSSKRLLRKMRMIPKKEFTEIIDKIKKFFPELV